MEQNKNQHVYPSVRDSRKGKMEGDKIFEFRRGRALLQLEQGSPNSDWELMKKSSCHVKCKYPESSA